MTHLINLSSDQLFTVELWRHQLFHDVNKTPEGVLLVHEEQSYGGDPVEPLAVLDLGVVETVGEQDTTEFRNS